MHLNEQQRQWVEDESLADSDSTGSSSQNGLAPNLHAGLQLAFAGHHCDTSKSEQFISS